MEVWLTWRFEYEVWHGGLTWRFDLEVWLGGLIWRFDLEVWLGGLTWRFDLEVWHRGLTWRFDFGVWHGGLTGRCDLEVWLTWRLDLEVGLTCRLDLKDWLGGFYISYLTCNMLLVLIMQFLLNSINTFATAYWNLHDNTWIIFTWLYNRFQIDLETNI